MTNGMVRKVLLPGVIPIVTALLFGLFLILIAPESDAAGMSVSQEQHIDCPSKPPQPGPTLLVNTTIMTTCGNICDVDHCTLREAIRLANKLPGPNIIELGNAATYTLTNRDNGSNGLPVITSTLTINGHGAIIARGSASATPSFRLLQIGAGGVAFLEGITFKNGYADGDVPDSFGGSIFNAGLLAANRCIFTGNYAFQDGGGIYTNQPMTITNSTLHGNLAGNVGAGIATYNSAVYVSNSTFYANQSPHGSGIFALNSRLTLLNNTFAGNSYESVLHDSGSLISVTNTIFSENNSALCIGFFIDGGGNLRQPGSDCPGSDGSAELGPLADNGGSTPTMALLEGSAAINAGVDGICASQLVGNKDQRGIRRPQGRHCDSGAFELESQPGPTLTVNNSAGTDDGLCTPGDCTLREAIFAANQLPGANTIELTAGTTYTLSEADNGSNGLPVITSTMTINGHGASIARSSVAANFRLLQIANGAALTLTQVTIQNGRLTSDPKGAGVYNAGALYIFDSTFSKNTCDADTTWGGALYNYYGALRIDSSTFYSNSATSYMSHGGAIYSNGGSMVIDNSTFVNNLAGGDYFDQGGAIYNSSVTTITNSTFYGNRVKVNYGGIIHQNAGRLTLRNSIMANSIGANNCSGTITDGGGNLSWPDTSCPGLNQDPKLSPLANNGGQTQTMALRANSPAIHQALVSNCPANDQRGLMRRLLNFCDIGSYEWVWVLYQPLVRK